MLFWKKIYRSLRNNYKKHEEKWKESGHVAWKPVMLWGGDGKRLNIKGRDDEETGDNRIQEQVRVGMAGWLRSWTEGKWRMKRNEETKRNQAQATTLTQELQNLNKTNHEIQKD